MSARFALSVALGLLVLGRALPASAYCLTRGCNDATEDCAYDRNQCATSGPLLRWPSSCVSFDVQEDGSKLRGIDYDAANEAIQTAFEQWLNADCGGHGPAISIMNYGPVECRRAEYNQDAGNANVIMFRDDSWPYANAIDTLALTTLIFNAGEDENDPEAGEIYDADVEVNTFESGMKIAPPNQIGQNDVDFASVITHELGHFLGLSHSNVEGSTMGQSYVLGQTEMASIEPDDVEGICAALQPDRSTSSSSCEPRHGFSSTCSVPDSGCSTSPGRSRQGGWLLALLGLSSPLLRRLRRADRRRAAGPGPRSDRGSAS